MSPPPTTKISWSRKKKPSQVAHIETPWPSSRDSDGRPSFLAVAPVAMITARAVTVVPSSIVSAMGRADRSAFVTRLGSSSAPNRAAWVRNLSISSGPMIPSGKPG